MVQRVEQEPKTKAGGARGRTYLRSSVGVKEIGGLRSGRADIPAPGKCSGVPRCCSHARERQHERRALLP